MVEPLTQRASFSDYDRRREIPSLARSNEHDPPPSLRSAAAATYVAMPPSVSTACSRTPTSVPQETPLPSPSARLAGRSGVSASSHRTSMSDVGSVRRRGSVSASSFMDAPTIEATTVLAQHRFAPEQTPSDDLFAKYERFVTNCIDLVFEFCISAKSLFDSAVAGKGRRQGSALLPPPRAPTAITQPPTHAGPVAPSASLERGGTPSGGLGRGGGGGGGCTTPVRPFLLLSPRPCPLSVSPPALSPPPAEDEVVPKPAPVKIPEQPIPTHKTALSQLPPNTSNLPRGGGGGGKQAGYVAQNGGYVSGGVRGVFGGSRTFESSGVNETLKKMERVLALGRRGGEEDGAEREREEERQERERERERQQQQQRYVTPPSCRPTPRVGRPSGPPPRTSATPLTYPSHTPNVNSIPHQKQMSPPLLR